MQNISKNAQLRAYEQIRDLILDGTYVGGMRLIESKLAEDMDMSRTPIREAIRRLEQEGLIKNKRVYQPTETDLRHIFQMRILIECYAAELASQFMIEDDIRRLEESIHIARNGTADEIVVANKKFHDLIVRECRNPIMIDTLDKMQAVIYLFSKAVVVHKRPFLIDEHEEICRAIHERDGQRASALMEKHLHADLEFSLSFVTKE